MSSTPVLFCFFNFFCWGAGGGSACGCISGACHALCLYAFLSFINCPSSFLAFVFPYRERFSPFPLLFITSFLSFPSWSRPFSGPLISLSPLAFPCFSFLPCLSFLPHTCFSANCFSCRFQPPGKLRFPCFILPRYS